jgi:putative flavoprotein involved in K+ transport
MSRLYETRRVETIVIGGGQAGLSVGYHLAKRGQTFLILDANPRIGDAWRNRWDSLRLFTPARYAGMPGFPFPARGDSFPTKDDMAHYLEQYARRFELPVRTGLKVDRLTKEGKRFVLTAAGERFEAENVVVAMADYQTPRTPEFAWNLDPHITQLHSHNYRNPAQLRAGGVLVVGVGNSGADIAMEVSVTHQTWLSGTESGHIPWPIEGFMGRFILVRFMRFLGHYVLTVRTRIGRKVRPKMLAQPAPLVRVKPKDLVAAGIERVPRVTGVSQGRPLLADDRTLNVANVIWCTGYHHSFPWIDLPIFGQDGKPAHERGVVPEVPGLYFVGLHFLYSMTSATVIGVGRDAEYIAGVIESRTNVATLESRPRVAKAG